MEQLLTSLLEARETTDIDTCAFGEYCWQRICILQEEVRYSILSTGRVKVIAT